MKPKYKMYIVTYDNNEILNDVCLNSLFISNFDEENLDVYVIDNHSNGHIYEQYQNKVTHLKNNLRPDFSTGHLSRSWNQAIVNGFKDLNSPDCEAVICVQVDSGFTENWYARLLNVLKKYDYIQEGCGDQFQVFTPDSVKQIGLFDERFCNICHQEADYFLRALIYNTYKSTINDDCHQRKWQHLSDRFFLRPSAHGAARRDKSFVASSKYTDVSLSHFKKKWGIDPNRWHETGYDFILNNLNPLIDSYILYPYFEKDIVTLREQRFNYDFNIS